MIEGRALLPMSTGRPIAHICAHCVEVGEGLFAQHERKNARLEKLPTPRQLVAHLDDYIIGQERVKKTLAVAVVNHYKRVLGGEITDPALQDVEVSKSNVLLIGPTGCGKTALAQTLARRLHVPFAIGDATTLTEAGYVGEDVENLILKLVMAADYDIPAAEKGIIYIDEIDKIGKTSQNVSITRDVSGEGVQQALLKLLEGTVANVPPQGGRKHPEQQYLQVNTTDILFICGGTFVGLEEIIGKRLGRKMIGFGRGDERQARPRAGAERAGGPGHSRGPGAVRHDPRADRPAPRDRHAQPALRGRPGPHPHRAEGRPHEAVPGALPLRRREGGVHRRRHPRDRPAGQGPGHRRARLAVDHGKPDARDHVRPSRAPGGPDLHDHRGGGAGERSRCSAPRRRDVGSCLSPAKVEFAS